MNDQKRVADRGASSIMDRITESFLSEFSRDRDLQGLDASAQFEHFAAFCAIRRHYNGDTFALDEVVVGSGGDTGIDAIAVLVNGSLVTDVEALADHADISGNFDVTFVFVQAERSTSFDGAKLGSFGFGVVDFFNDNPKLVRNDMVKERAELMESLFKFGTKFRPDNPTCKLYYITTGTWTDDANLEARRTAVEDDLNSLGIFSNVECVCLGASGLQRFYREAKNSITREFTFTSRILVPDIPGVTEAYLGFVPLSEFLSIVKDDNGDLNEGLFYDNVRGWQDYNSVNSEIKETILSPEKSRFVLMNNGITIIARTLRPLRRDRIQLEDFQIVNGCQTSHVLFDCRNEGDDSVAVPLRLIATTEDAVINSIIRATNRQTKVEEEQFFALTDFAEQLEEYFQTFPDPNKLYYERRSRQYASRSGQSRIVTHGNLVRAVASMFLSLPHQTTRSYKALKDAIGKDIFVKGHKLDPYYVSAFALYRLEAHFRNAISTKLKPARFHILMAARLLANREENLPKMNSREMERYCAGLRDILWDPTRSAALFVRAAQIVEASAGGNFHRDNIRTLPFTAKVISECKEDRKADDKA